MNARLLTPAAAWGGSRDRTSGAGTREPGWHRLPMLPVSGSQGKTDVQPWGSSVPATRGEAGLSGNALREDVAAGDPEPTATGRPAGLKASRGAGRRSEGTSPSRSPDLAGVCVRTRAGVYRTTEGPKAQGPRWDWQRGLRGGHRPRRHSLPQKEPVPRPVCQALSPAPSLRKGRLRR